MTKSKKNSKQNIVRQVSVTTYSANWNPSTNQFVEVSVLSCPALGTLNSTIDNLYRLYSQWKINRITIEMFDSPSGYTNAGISYPCFLAYIQGTEAPNALADIDTPYVSNIAFGDSHGAAGSSLAYTYPGKHCVLKLDNANLTQPIPGSWLATELAQPVDIQSNYGSIYAISIAPGNSNTYTRIFRITTDLSFKNLKDIDALRRNLPLLPIAHTDASVEPPEKVTVNGKVYFLSNTEVKDHG